MKKIALVLTLAASIVLTACSGGKDNGRASDSTSKTGDTKTNASQSGSDKTGDSQASETGVTAAKVDLSSIAGDGDRLDKIIEAGVITCATSPDFAPNEFQDISSGEVKYVGADIDLANYIADFLGVKLEIKPMDFDAVKAAVTTGQADIAISGFAYTEERAESMELSEFFNTDDKEGQGVLVLKKDVDKYKTAEDFKGKKVAAQNSSVQYELTVAQLGEDVCQPIVNINDAIMMLKTGKVDGVALDMANAELYVGNYDDTAICEFKFDYTSSGNVAAVKKGETKLINAVNLIIKDVNDKGLYTKWREEAIKLAKSLGVEVNE